MCSILYKNEKFVFKRNALSNINRCFILGNGPTLKKFDLQKLRDEFTIGVNWIALSGFIPNLICITDPLVLCDKLVSLLNNANTGLVLHSSFAKPAIEKYKLNKKLIVKTFKIKFPHDIYGKSFQDLYNDDFSETKAAHSVLADAALPTAMYLGLKHIYLLGVDDIREITCNGWEHFYRDQEDTGNKPLSDSAKSLAYSLARIRDVIYSKIDVFAGLQNKSIINLTPGSAIMAFERQDAHDIIDYAININPQSPDIYNKFIEIGKKIYLITPANNNDDRCISLKSIMSDKYLRHYKGKIIDSNSEINSRLFNQDSSYIIESGFTNLDKISLRSANMKNMYVVKLPYSEGYSIKKYNGDFIPQQSEFFVFPE